jgi:hypothetical protein
MRWGGNFFALFFFGCVPSIKEIRMNSQTSESGAIPRFGNGTARQWLLVCAASYGLYALFLLIEVLDFLSLLHSKPPGESATYTIVHVTYFVVEMVVCLGLAFVFLLMPANTHSGRIAGLACLAFSVGRLGLVYYLYLYTDGESHWVPFIYKVANEFSDAARVIFLPAQVLFGLVSGWFCWRAR